MNIYGQIFKKHGLSATQKEILSFVGQNKTILEIGSSTGYMTKLFLNNGCIVDVVETNKEALVKLPKGVRGVLNCSIEDLEIKNLPDDYDYIILADVLEHLVSPEKALKLIYKIATKKTRLIISLPNVASWIMRKQLFFKGDFEYQESGILDKTHLHFYTVNTLPKLLLKNSWKVEKIIGTIIRLPFEESINKIPVINWFFRNFLYKNLTEKYKNLSYYHFLTIASKR